VSGTFRWTLSLTVVACSLQLVCGMSAFASYRSSLRQDADSYICLLGLLNAGNTPVQRTCKLIE
jgi:hypothetical protein